MKKFLSLFILLLSFYTNAQVTLSVGAIEVDQSVTITVDINSTDSDCNGLSSPAKVYMHSGIGDNTDAFGFSVIGNWGQDDGVGEMTNNNDGTWSITITPETYYGLNATQVVNATQIGIVFRNEDGSQELKDNGCNDFIFPVGNVTININNPSSPAVALFSGDDLPVSATITFQGSITVQGSYEIFFNDVSVATGNCGFPTCSATIQNITESGIVRFEGSPPSSSDTGQASFEVFVLSTVVEEDLPPGVEDGINYDSDPTKATLVLSAPRKEFVQVAGSFNNYSPTNADVMKRDPGTGKYWLELTGLTSGQIETYQYWVYDTNPVAGSPSLVKTADPFSTLVLSPFDDPSIPASTYPSLPVYPAGQEREVTVLQTGKTPYNWEVTNFNKPKKEDLVIYEVLIRDFDADRNFQGIIDKIDYFKNLNINAIELMPVMEFEGNESWGYNTAFHMSLDKFYGTEEKFKELIDVCHQNGIAVILDIAINHAFGRNPMVRMWMDDADGDGWGEPSSENPYFNETAKHAYSVGSDFDHSNSFTKVYTKRVVKHWIEDFNIDGFRWDLTKGFTQNCSSGDEGCTNSYQADRVAILKDYADYSWLLDETHYVIFEHLGADNEEQQWANYRIGDAIPKGVMMWSEMWTPYKNLAQGQSSDINFDRMGHTAHGFTEKRSLGYPESHDKDRIMYEMTEFGINTEPIHNVRDLNNALTRMSALGAVTLTIPGPKMVWHFADLGMENSIWTCSNGVVNSDYDGNIDGDCKLDTKPQPQWTNNWLGNANRNQIYNDWSRLNALKINEAVFEGSYSITSGTQTPRISIYTGDENTSGSELKNVIVLANFSVTSQTVNPNFPYSGNWYDLMDESNTPATIIGSTTSINLGPGEFRVYGNQASTLSVEQAGASIGLKIFPNPTNNTFSLNKNISKLDIYSITGKLIKTYNGDFRKGNAFNISNLKQSIYLVKAINNLGEVSTIKLIKI